MKNITRIILVLLSITLMISCFVGCKKENEDEKSNTTVTTVNSDVDPEIGDYTCELPSDLNYEGKEITIIGRDAVGQSDEFLSEGESDSIILSAVYRRNAMVENRLGVKLNVITFADDSTNDDYTVVSKVEADVINGAGEFDIVTAPAYTAFHKVLDGIFYNLQNVENLNLDKYYWAQGFNEYAEVGGAQYLATGAIALSLYRFMYITVYNNDMFEQQGLENLYDKVKNNTWTVEEQYQMASKLYVDNGRHADSFDDEDTYGFVSGARTSADAYLAAFDANVVSKDNDGYITYIGSQEKFVGIADKMLKLYYGSDGSYIIPTAQDNTDNADIAKMFMGKKVAMASMKVQALETYIKGVDFEYSIAPLPKYDANQESFGTYVQDQVTIMALPNAVSEDDIAMLGAVMECLADESYKQTYDAYFETALSYQYLQNEESLEMLQIIYESVDMGGFISCFTTGVGWNGILRAVAGTKINSVSYQFASITANVNNQVEEINQKYRDLLVG